MRIRQIFPFIKSSFYFWIMKSGSLVNWLGRLHPQHGHTQNIFPCSLPPSYWSHTCSQSHSNIHAVLFHQLLYNFHMLPALEFHQSTLFKFPVLYFAQLIALYLSHSTVSNYLFYFTYFILFILLYFVLITKLKNITFNVILYMCVYKYTHHWLKVYVQTTLCSWLYQDWSPGLCWFLT